MKRLCGENGQDRTIGREKIRRTSLGFKLKDEVEDLVVVASRARDMTTGLMGSTERSVGTGLVGCFDDGGSLSRVKSENDEGEEGQKKQLAAVSESVVTTLIPL
jgi:hypothetical protein